MALFGKKLQNPQLTLPRISRSATYIEEGCTLSGQLQFHSGVRIDGRVEGEVRARGTVIVGETGEVEASVFADIVVVLGEVVGDIEAQTLVALHKGARVRGDICTSGIVVEPGSNFRGSIVIGPEEALTLADEAGAPADAVVSDPASEASEGPLDFEESDPIVKIRSAGG